MNVVITGANRGIGNAMVQAFAKEHHNIWACARAQNTELELQLQQLSEKYQVWIEPVYFDLSSEAEMKAGVKSIISKKVPVDVLVNNAGIASGGTLLTTSLSKLRQVFEIDFFAQIQMMQLISKAMIRQQSGCIINMSSVAGSEIARGYFAYGAAKSCIDYATKMAAKDLAPFNIRVNSIAPGLIDSDMGHYKEESQIQQEFDRTLIKRFGTPDEVATLAVYLASDAAAYITGQVLLIDGGRVI